MANSNGACRGWGLLVLAVLAGCGGQTDTIDRLAVSGTVTRGSDAVERGSVSFLPLKGTDGPSATVLIVDGEYRFDRTNGPCAGNYQVLITPHSEGKSLPHSGSKPEEGSSNESWTGAAEVSPEELLLDFDIEPES